MAEHELTDGLLSFIFGGNATFTIMSEATQARYTYKVTARKDNSDGKIIHFVKLLRGANNVEDYAYMGCIINKQRFTLTSKSKVSEKAKSVIAFDWFINKLVEGKKVPNSVHFYHAGRCARCGRKLTVPESIESGFGPECASRL